MPTKDKEKKREYQKQWYQENKEALRIKRLERFHRNPEIRRAKDERYRKGLRDFIDDLKKAGVCIRCGIDDYRVLNYHHRDPSQKKIGLSWAWKQRIGKQAILDEIAKCDLICANCHRILHWEEQNAASVPGSRSPALTSGGG